MTRYQQTVRTTNVTTGQGALEILAGPMGCRVFAIKVVSASAAVTELGVGRPAVMGDSPVTPTVFGAVDGANNSQSKLALSWGTSPTAPASFFDRVSMPAGIGFVKEFLFPAGIAIPRGQSLTLHNITGGATFDVTVDLQEQLNTVLSYADVVQLDGPIAYWRLGEKESYAQAVLSSAPLGYWRMDAPSGTSETDRSTFNNPGTYQGSFALVQTGALSDGDKAAAFSVGNGYLDLGNTASLRPTAAFTLEAWVNLNPAVFPDGATNWVIYDWQVALASGVQFRVDGATGKLQLITNQAGASTSALSNTPLTKNAYYHVAVTFDGTTARFYLNGVADGSGAITAPISAANIVTISRNGQGMIGSMDEVALYDYALSAVELSNHYALRLSVLTTVAVGTVADQIGSWPAKIFKGAVSNVAGATFESNTAFQFDGATGSYIETNAVFNAPLGVGPMSIELWFKRTANVVQMGMIDNKDAGSNNAGFNVFVITDNMNFRIANGVTQTNLSTPGTYTDGRWHHVVGTLSRGTPNLMSIYIDGVLVSSGNPAADGWDITSAQKLRIGAYTTGGAPNFFIGIIDEVAIYAKALTDLQVLAHFRAR